MSPLAEEPFATVETERPSPSDVRDKTPAQRPLQPLQVIARVCNRAVRLSLDAVVILVFSPLILVWQLSERRKRANGKKI